jgi:EthD domain
MTYKLVYLARRAKTVAREDWPRTWKSHAVFASQFPVLEAGIEWMRYCNRIDAPGMPGLSAEHDGVSVAGSSTLEALNGAGFSTEDRERIDLDELRVFDMLTPNFTWYCEERLWRDGPPGEAAVFTFLKRKPEISREAFADWLGGANGLAVGEAIAGLPAVTRFANNLPLSEPLPLFPFDGIAECWFASPEDALAAFRGGELAPLRQDYAAHCDLASSTVMLTGVCHRWPKVWAI